MTIIHAPHPTLRQRARLVTRVDKKLTQLIKDLGHTLLTAKNPQGVGLASPQIDRGWAIFCTYLPETAHRRSELRFFINPSLIKHSSNTILGETAQDKKPRLEGCLSIPKLYGAVPRYQWVEFEFDQIENNRLVRKTEKFMDFPARVMQHEYDHLNGILFTDHSLKNNLPVWRELADGEMEEVDQELLKLL